MSGVHKVKHDPRQEFLRRSAELLKSVVPGTSAYLSAERIALLHEKMTPVFVGGGGQQLCLACGSLREPPEEDGNSKNRGVAGLDGSREETNRLLAHECRLCHRMNRATISPAIGNGGRGRRETDAPVAPGSLNDTALLTPSTATSSSGRMRAKARKQGTLQALLEKRKTTPTQDNNTGLDLMDLFKTA